jgi:metal-responsive CopG/Arc/MetJ family transcriptional regulator
VGVRLQPDLLAALDAHIAEKNRSLTRPEAIRELLSDALAAVGRTVNENNINNRRIDRGCADRGK